jgi:hypothetical protein
MGGEFFGTGLANTVGLTITKNTLTGNDVGVWLFNADSAGNAPSTATNNAVKINRISFFPVFPVAFCSDCPSREVAALRRGRGRRRKRSVARSRRTSAPEARDGYSSGSVGCAVSSDVRRSTSSFSASAVCSRAPSTSWPHVKVWT